jgi:hypothetical protein
MKVFTLTVFIAGSFLLECSVPLSAHAVDLSESVQLHGYGHVGALNTDSNSYLNANNGTTWDYKDLALLFTGKINERSNAWIELFSIEGKNRVDWAFVDYQVANGPLLRLGQIKLPIGLYNEIRDIEFIRPSSLQPFLYQESVDITSEAYRGAGLAYDHEFGRGGLTWDIYGGETVEYDTGEHKHTGLLGGRVSYQTPVEGLRAMLSTFAESLTLIATNESSDKHSYIISLDYSPGELDLKTEFGLATAFGKKIETWYVQAAYSLNENWKPYLRYDYITTDVDNSSDPSFYQYATVVGLGYTINANFGLRMETHFNHGYAMPVVADQMSAGTGAINWKLSAISLNFNF